MHSIRDKIQRFFVETPRYERLEAEKVQESSDSNSVNSESGPLRRKWCLSVVPWVLCAVLACGNLYQLSARSRLPVSTAGTFWTGLDHELSPATAHISYQEVQFTGSAVWADDGVYSLTRGPDQPNYVGEPTQEIDDAWEDLIRDRFFSLSEEEAKAQYGDKYTMYRSPVSGEYTAYVDAMHLLHCLNRIRQSYHPDRYINETKWGPLDPMDHNYHCIDLIRQSLMCHADLTAIPARFFKGLGFSYIDSDQTHTCRNFTKIQEWVRSRKDILLDGAYGTILDRFGYPRALSLGYLVYGTHAVRKHLGTRISQLRLLLGYLLTGEGADYGRVMKAYAAAVASEAIVLWSDSHTDELLDKLERNVLPQPCPDKSICKLDTHS